jgi:hypothetical protein
MQLAMAVTLVDPVAINPLLFGPRIFAKMPPPFKQELSWPKDVRFAGKARTTEM